MKPEQITALAREYAEEIYPHEEGEDLGQMEFLRTSAAKHIEASLKMLSRRFCLVEKSKATELCRLALEHGDSVDYGLIDGLTDIVCDILPEQYEQVAEGLDNPEIAKEVQL